MASNNEHGIWHLRALVPWLMMMIMILYKPICKPSSMCLHGFT